MIRRRIRTEHLFFEAPTLLLLLLFAWFVGSVVAKGASSLDLAVLTSSVKAGGLLEPLIGTVLLLCGAVVIATPIGVATAVYLEEYASNSRVSRLVTQAVSSLAGVPSIVLGLFGYAFFCRFLGLGVSLASGWLTLACMILPIVVRGSQEAIRMVPKSFRAAARALGASKWRTVVDVVLPTAAPGIATSVVLGLARVAGETAAILFTCSALTGRVPITPLEPVVTLTYYIFASIVAVPGGSLERAFSATLILLLAVLALNSMAYAARIYYRRKWGW